MHVHAGSLWDGSLAALQPCSLESDVPYAFGRVLIRPYTAALYYHSGVAQFQILRFVIGPSVFRQTCHNK